MANEACSIRENSTANTQKILDKMYECKLYEIAEGKRLTEEKAKMYVENMKPSAKWSMEDIEKVRSQTGVNIPKTDFYVIMNMLTLITLMYLEMAIQKKNYAGIFRWQRIFTTILILERQVKKKCIVIGK